MGPEASCERLQAHRQCRAHATDDPNLFEHSQHSTALQPFCVPSNSVTATSARTIIGCSQRYRSISVARPEGLHDANALRRWPQGEPIKTKFALGSPLSSSPQLSMIVTLVSSWSEAIPGYARRSRALERQGTDPPLGLEIRAAVCADVVRLPEREPSCGRMHKSGAWSREMSRMATKIATRCLRCLGGPRI